LRKIFIIFSCLVLFFGCWNVLPRKADALSGNEPTYTYWLQSSSTPYKTSYGKWVTRSGYSHGPMKKTYSYSTNTSFSIESSAGISKNNIKSGLSVSFTAGKKISTSATCKIPKNKKGAYQTRDVYKHYKVKMDQWKSIDGRKSKTGATKTVKIKKKVSIEDRCHIINK
jgi:hypothetical protein